MTRSFSGFVLMIGFVLSLVSCHKTLEPTAIQIEDSIRHYPATILGEDLEMEYVVRNIGNDMLMISDIQPAVPTIEVDKENVDMILDEVYEDHFRSSSDRCGELFTFRLKAKEYSIPFERILYFESRNKKMIIRTETQELEFYGTLDSVMSAAPQCFMRIHKSFIANIDRISVVDYGKMTVEFDDGSAVLLSRTFKAQLKERLNAKGEL